MNILNNHEEGHRAPCTVKDDYGEITSITNIYKRNKEIFLKP